MNVADKPGADLVALFAAIAALPEGHRADLTLHGVAAAAALRAWAETRGLRVEQRSLCTPMQGPWTFAEVKLPGGRIGVHEVAAQPAPADQQVLTRVQAALDGGQPEAAEGSV